MDIDLETKQDIVGAITAQSEEKVVQPITADGPPIVKTAAERVAEAFSSVRAPVAAAAMLPSNFEIIQKLAIHLEQQSRKQYYLLVFLAFLLMVMGISCFIILGYISVYGAIPAICIMCGVFLVMTSFFIFVSAITEYHVLNRQPAIVAQGPIRYVMRIEGDQWKRFLTYFYSALGRPSGCLGCCFCCKRGRQHHQRLLMNGHGHIVLGSLGFMIDELYCTTYDRNVVLNVELLSMESATNEDNNEPIIDTIMRVWLCRRVNTRRWGPPTPFKVDIFLASQLPSYEIPGIVNCVAIR